ncbi:MULTISPECIES: carboxymuconolactone decarboxylase family protein [unclassified Streptomyces]|uniref:carboxymuconolactone decarboxylase family protein n=1 Tax=unclassified Streptomyces TaxID=2593676 RepID=UPI002DDBE7CB|nr:MULTISPECIES: carboxymuconolactone decarboxylase family protein [unclassified Streptomyces]WSA92839.1 carboxymuconolactone decarboxylase family protein [Streptomyces sp. NBC_01795]WSB77209.1 carboxymuconolactone decarboxylase family protein [Streptomyces sp. NBC_01775]WSS14526.1 carboxymuconolactone decarboxylase family protein [Streptomyces sp. NBC_01186]WSS43344.1 carboxymuconolactone decarboxylase family protein [Streptomyces sp. NBC_01187]
MTTTPRMEIWKIAPAVAKGMYAFQKAATEQGLDPVIQELVKIRASQLNKCAYCLDMHLTDARKNGEDQLRLDLITAWEEAGDLFTEREQAALALTEAVTVLTDGHVPDGVYQRAATHFDENELAALIAQITAINAWNRFAVTTRALPQTLVDRESGGEGGTAR